MVEATSALLLELIELIELPQSELMQYVIESLYFTITFIYISYLIDSRQLVSRHILHESIQTSAYGVCLLQVHHLKGSFILVIPHDRVEAIRSEESKPFRSSFFFFISCVIFIFTDTGSIDAQDTLTYIN